MPKNIKNLITEPHWINARYNSYWDFLLLSYEGGIDYCNAVVLGKQFSSGIFDNQFRYFVNGVQQSTGLVTGNLFMHPKELTEDYNRRVKMSYFYNCCAPVIDIYSDHLFKQPVVVEWAELQETIDQVGDNIDQQGSSIQEFRIQMAKMTQIYGHCFVLTDSPDYTGTQILTKKDQIEKRAYPYVTLYKPGQLKNWSLDRFGKPFWILMEEPCEINPTPDDYDKNNLNKCQYRLWTREDWALYDNDYNLIDAGNHNLGEVPITCVYDKKSEKAKSFLGISQISDISFINRDIYNACSELRQILRDQTFAFLALQGESSEYSAVDLGTGKGLIYPPERNAPQYVSPPADNAQTYFTHISNQIAKIYQIAKLDAGVAQAAPAEPSGGGAKMDTQSGVSKAWSFAQTNSCLSSKSSNLEDAELSIWRQIAKWQDKEFTGTIQYPNEYSITSLQDDLDEAEQESRLGLGKTFNLEIRKDIIKKKYPRKSDKEIELMAKEIEADLDRQEKQKNTVGSSIAERFRGQFGNGNLATATAANTDTFGKS